MKNILQNVLNSLDNKTSGYSGKKLTIIAIVICVVSAHVKWITLGNFDQLTTVLTIDFSFITAMFGINVYDKKQPIQSTPDENKP